MFSIFAAEGNEMHSSIKNLVVLPALFHMAVAWSIVFKLFFLLGCCW
jgi:hypothetical protein